MNINTEVTSKDLCISCRACAQVCAHDAISFSFSDGLFKPAIDHDRCTDCGLCTLVCPSYKVNLKGDTPEKLFVGEIQKCYTAYARDKQIRFNSTSGGVITSLIINLLKSGDYSKAAVVKYNALDGQAEYTITSNIATIKAAAKSKYIPVSTSAILEHIAHGVKEPLIVVATPCQISAIKSFCALKRISDEEILYLGLLCESTLNYNIYNYYSTVYGSYDALYFRSKKVGGWPGHTLLEQGKRERRVTRSVRTSLKPYFRNNRCRYCFDKLNREADISFGDCYAAEDKAKEGVSHIIIRSDKGARALSAVSEHMVLSPTPTTQITQSQQVDKRIENYARAKQLNPQIYNNYPLAEEPTIDIEVEKQTYSNLRIGAEAQSRSDYRRIRLLLKPKGTLKQLLRKVEIALTKL